MRRSVIPAWRCIVFVAAIGLPSAGRVADQHLRGPDQHLRGPDQHFRSPDQHFRDPDQHLRSPDQHFRGTDQHLRKTDQHLRESTTSQTGASRFALAIVEDGHGRATVDVGADDFLVEESGAAREILDVRVADYPVAIVLDNGTAASADFEAMRTAVIRMVERLGVRPVSIVTTAGGPTTIATFEDDREVVLERLQKVEWSGADDGQTLRAAAAAAEAIRTTGALFSAIVIVAAAPASGEGSTDASLTAPVIDSRAVVHVVASSRTGDERAPGAGDGGVLRSLATQTHGQFTAIYAAPSFQPALDRVVARLTTEMLIEYLVPVGSKAADVKIGVRMPGARVRGLGVAPK